VATQRKELEMALSDQLTKLAARAKEVEDRAAAAKAEAKADLEREVKNARESAQAQADALTHTASRPRATSPSGGTTCSRRGTST
jgi:hypothetical protein